MGLKPRGKIKKYVGIEIEFVSLFNLSDCRNKLREHKMHKWCDIVTDGSIEGPSGEDLRSDEWNDQSLWGLELRILSTEGDLSKRMPIVQEFLNEVAMQVNESCGLHVHLDMRNRDIETVAKIFLNRQQEFRGMVPYHRQESTYCHPLREDSLYEERIEQLPFDWRTATYPRKVTKIFTTRKSGRYSDINVTAYNKHKTIEIRIHEGTLDCSEILNWCKYLICICNGKEGSIDRSYVNKRIASCS